MWAIYPPGDTTFTPGRALAIATVTQLTNQDARANYPSPGKTIPDHSRAVALMPAPTGEKIPIQILEVPDAKRKHMEDMLVTHIPNVKLVGPGQSALFLVNSDGNTVQLLAADGIQLVGSFDADGDNWATGLAVVVSRSATANELLTLDNPSSQLKVSVRVANAPRPAKQKNSQRRIAVVAADTQPVKYRIRKSGNPRTAENSLQLKVRVNADSYLTIVDVDSEGGVNLLFPNDAQASSFYPDGLVKAGATTLIPDSIRQGNKAGFYWDYTPPKGTDTVRVFSSTDLETAQMFRQRVKELQATATRTPGKIGTRSIGTHSITTVIKSIREYLSRAATRGLVAVYDPTSHIPGPVDVGQPNSPASVPTPEPASSLPESISAPDALMANPTGPAPDWAGTSVTILVEG
jgi:hypothetical protein